MDVENQRIQVEIKSPKKAQSPKQEKVKKLKLKRPVVVKATDFAERPRPKDTTKAEDLPTKPKRPVAGAWGVFLQEQRAEIVKSLPADHKITDVTKKAAEVYKALSEEERKAFEEKFKKNTETYKKAVEDYRVEMLKNGHSLETTPSKKGKANNVTPTKVYKPVKVGPEAIGPIDADALHEAKGLGYEEAFRSLISCTLMIEKKIPHDKIVRTLRASGGKEKKAFEVLSRC